MLAERGVPEDVRLADTIIFIFDHTFSTHTPNQDGHVEHPV